MGVIDNLQTGLNNAVGIVNDYKTEILVGAGGLALGAGVGIAAASISSKSKAKRKRKSSSRSKRKRSITHHHSKKHKSGKHYSHRRIHKTKNGQPYIILASGKARFIKKTSARQSRKRKGGRY
jgi:hypothetical protein